MITCELMLGALREAKKASKLSEVPVGCIIYDYKNKKIIAKAHNQNIKNYDCTAHSEILALRKACRIKKTSILDDCDLYVTLEPCSMCASAISFARIRRVYFGCEDKKSGGVYNGAKVFEVKSCHHKPEIYDGILKKESSKLLKDFFKNLRKSS
jgi:tRNA(adenine34) deaminase